MTFKNWMHKRIGLHLRTIIRFYPPFLLLGLKARISVDGKSVVLKVPSRWFYSNNNGVTFGGILLLISDPFPSLLFEKIIPNVKAWTVEHSIEYLRPIKGEVTATVNISDEAILYFTNELRDNRSAKMSFEYFFEDKRGRKVARVSTTSYLRKLKEPK